MRINLGSKSDVPSIGQMPAIRPTCPEGKPRLAFVGDYMWSKEDGSPLHTSHYATLFYLCKDLGLNLNECFISNCLNFAPSEERFTKVRSTMQLKADDPLIKESLDRLFYDLAEWRPDFVILLGKDTLYLLKGNKCQLEKERGSPFRLETSRGNFMCLASYHPKETFEVFPRRVLLQHDIKRALHWAQTPWQAPKFNLQFLPQLPEVIAFLKKVLSEKPLLSVDIETNYADVITCLCLCPSDLGGLVIPFVKGTESYWPREQELVIWPLLAQVLEECPLLGHNAVHFDHLVLAQHYGIEANFVEDTMFLQWEQAPELPKSLAFTNSLYGDLPYWKGELGEARSVSGDYWREYEYNGKDGCTTMHTFKALEPSAQDFHYRFNISTSKAFQYMSLLGAHFDKDKRDARVVLLKEETRLEIEKFSCLSGKLHADVLASKGKKKGEFSVRSNKDMQAWLYDELRLPPIYKKTKDDFGETEDHETADFLALLHLAHDYPSIPALAVAGKIRKLLKRISSLEAVQTRPDGTVSWGFNLVGTSTSRVSGYKPLDGLGVQPQNVDRRDRDLFLPAIVGWDWYKFDLEGADAWTVAAILKFLGHDEMMLDLEFGLKPAQRAALAIILGDTFMSEDRSTIKDNCFRLKASDEGKRSYLVGKKVSHGTNYKMGKKTMSESIFKETEGDLYVSPQDCEKTQKLLLDYYHIEAFHKYAEWQLVHGQELITCFGMKHKFLGRSDSSTAKEMMALLPQANTTFTTNVVLNRLFYNEANRRNGDLVLRLCNQVHDEGDAIGDPADRDKIREIFYSLNEVPLSFENINFTIPFDADRGTNWGDCKTPIKG